MGWLVSRLSSRCTCRSVAQLAEHRSPKPRVGGSTPSGPAIFDFFAVQLNLARFHLFGEKWEIETHAVYW